METVLAKSCQSVSGMKRGLAAQVTGQLHGYQVGVVVVVVVFFYFPSEASTVLNTTLKRADNRVEGCGVRKIIIRDV